MTPGLTIADARVRRGRREVLHGVSLTIEPGAVTALLGPNGAGKSSLVALLGGLLSSSTGDVALDGRSLRGLTPDRIRAAGLAIVPEGHRVLAELTVEDNLRAGLAAVRRRDQRERIDAVLERLPELGERLGQRAGSLSGGQQQMLAVAQALAARPRYLVVDELSLGLAPAVVRRLAQVLVDLAGTGVGVLLIEQFTSLALEVSTNAYVLQGGRVTLAGTAAALREDRAALADAYLAAPAEVGGSASAPAPAQ
ncbi:High-affinity branched-chain amino acid transport ATP-binding protein LivF [Baekduia alba]|uniref:ABC transporter ATP-binding protein n=1 Tax=Baekduia alba TaxID=2997333 RepID=UPI0023413625|nr:ABC transporter ATP-binding protein [Baekduia alba]WCB95273.1 High-affinity branched-chain amino acid transport ATP-binding protein LivF [Baekduia alba]